MKIAVTGPHCCGKSTVLKKVEEKLVQKYGRLEEVVFHSFSGKSSPIDYSSAQSLKNESNRELLLTYWMLSKLIERECDFALDIGGLHIYDRCVLDQIVYSDVLMSKENSKYIRDYVNFYCYKFPYDQVFVLPANYEILEKYGTKDKNPEYVEQICIRYNSLTSEYKNIVYLPLDQQEQVNIIMSYIENGMKRG
ncbi:MAG: AAA family ATPase [Lachnospiraceae bacterium]|nr:AAA family ATPase [Lachnospiraceae bacterium]